MSADLPSLLRFEEAYFDRVWGGRKMQSLLAKPVPEGRTIGEAWLVADHPVHESVAASGAYKGWTLRRLLESFPDHILGACPRLTPSGRFPLLLKILDAAEPLSVQVHPDDAAALRLGEPDAGKTEMWYVLDSDPGSELICGLDERVTRETLFDAIAQGRVAELLQSFPAPKGTGVFVSARTVHAIGSGFLLAEIQQNSDLTYRVYDWDRDGLDGKPRPLHLKKAGEVIDFGAVHPGAAPVLTYEEGGSLCRVIGACPYFAAELRRIEGSHTRGTEGRSFHLLLAESGPLEITSGGEREILAPGQALLVSGASRMFSAEGDGSLLDYYVPDLAEDIQRPLLAAGHSREDIASLGGPGAANGV